MNPLPQAKILILSDSQATARRWAELLRGPDVQLWLDPDRLPDDARPEVVLTDTVEVDDEQLGVVRVGGSGRGDVELPGDAPGGELRLACRLLAEIVRLRRRGRREEELRGRLRQEARSDPLTGLPNRRAWEQALVARLAALGASMPLCLAIFDLDHFKRINDAHGHAVGDEVLRQAGRAIRQALRQEDFVARVGGDEFALLVRVPDPSTAAAVLERVRAGLPSRLIQAGTHAVTASAGYRVVRPDEARGPPLSAEGLYAAADAALREAKVQGRDRTLEAAGDAFRRSAKDGPAESGPDRGAT